MFPRFDSETLIIIDPKKQPILPCFVVANVPGIHDIVFRQLMRENKSLCLYAFNEAGYRQLPLTDEDSILGCMVEAKWLAQ